MDFVSYIGRPVKQRGFFSAFFRLCLYSLLPPVPIGYGIELTRRVARFGPQEAELLDPANDISVLKCLWEGLSVIVFGTVVVFPFAILWLFMLCKDVPMCNYVLALGQLLYFVALPAVYMRLAARGGIYDCKMITSIVKICPNIYLGLAVTVMIWNALSSLGILFFIVGIIFVNVYFYMAYPYLLGSFMREHRDELIQCGAVPGHFFNYDPQDDFDGRVEDIGDYPSVEHEDGQTSWRVAADNAVDRNFRTATSLTKKDLSDSDEFCGD